jgi:hypothetical protein
LPFDLKVPSSSPLVLPRTRLSNACYWRAMILEPGLLQVTGCRWLEVIDHANDGCGVMDCRGAFHVWRAMGKERHLLATCGLLTFDSIVTDAILRLKRSGVDMVCAIPPSLPPSLPRLPSLLPLPTTASHDKSLVCCGGRISQETSHATTRIR